MKTCTKCGIEKPLSEFHNSARAKDGKFSACKACRNGASREAAAKLDQSALYKKRMEEKGEQRANQGKVKVVGNQ